MSFSGSEVGEKNDCERGTPKAEEREFRGEVTRKFGVEEMGGKEIGDHPGQDYPFVPGGTVKRFQKSVEQPE